METPLPASTNTATEVLPQVTAQDEVTWVDVPAGGFLMGSATSDAFAGSDEKPQHTVYLDAFSIMQIEVTNAMYAKCVEVGACEPPSSRASFNPINRSHYYENPEFANYPVVYVSWEDASNYCAWAGGRLPTEAEWEKAARGSDGRLYPWGDELPDAQRGNFDGNVADTTPVGAYPTGVSPYGALDMAGNVREWTADWYDERYYWTSPAQNPPGPDAGQLRVLRGGAWNGQAWDVRAAYRLETSSYNGDGLIGFRCVRNS
jgi:formylglycine-generating enzyme required for sulfatase activity